jgi:YD repeat-containing protein
MLGYTGTALRLSWLPSGEANISGYSVELLANGGSSETDTPTVSPQTFAASFTSGIVFTAQVRSIGPNTKGPWSTLASGPYQADIVYTYDALGRLGSVAWDAGFTEAYGFDSTGNLLSATYPATQP